MIETIQADRLAILTRHAMTPANRAKYEDAADRRIQGLSIDMPLADPEGILEAHAYGLRLARFEREQPIDIVNVYAADTARTIATRDLVLMHMPRLAVAAASRELRERNKGDLEGKLKSEAYPNKQVMKDWDYRHGTLKSGSETSREAAERWLDWFRQATQQPNFQPRKNYASAIPTIIVFGHNAITACGITLLTHDGKRPLPPASDRTFRVEKNAIGLILAEQDSQWSALSEKLIPTESDFEAAKAYVAKGRM